ncbi:DNA polymerase III subunit alpha [Candidatus Wolfebacteria bacterium]|nr:MAG: DNA polymerase III subunit alpha [Candidatus Wolfebacteria bacterium]
MAKKPPFIHLHTHSHYSLLDGLSKIDDIVQLAKKYKMPAVALTDHGNMYGAIEFYKKCKAAGIKPIMGVEAYVAERTRFDKEPGLDNRRYHLTLLSKNEIGYKNLIKIVTQSNLEGFYYKPRVDKELLAENSEGIICLSGCPAGELAHALREQNMKKAHAVIKEHQNIFGKENYFLELMEHPEVEGSDLVKKGIIELSKELSIPIVGTWDTHYPHIDDNDAHDTLIAINTGSDVGSSKMSMKAGNYSFINTKDATEAFKDIPEAIENTNKVADLCDINLELGTWVFPDFKTEDGSDLEVELRRLISEGLIRRKMEKTKEVDERIEYELDVIITKGYTPYFLVVADLLRFARDSNILSTTRGSAAGSIVSYLTGITNVDPLFYDLPFERFLNPDRPSAPDVDMDFADNRRDEVIEYAKKKYGEDKVAQIGTFGTMMARGAVRDVARALGYPYDLGDRISKLIPLGAQGMPMTIDKALKLVPELKQLYKDEKDVHIIMEMAKKLEGSARHISVHAAGVVISPTPLTDFVPTQLDPKGGKIITQYDMHSVEDAGLLKFDFLGLKNLAILGDAVRRVKKIRDIDIDIETIPIDDKKTFEMLARGETSTLFQLNGDGMTKFLKELRPTTIHDINAMVALYRPGPIKNIPEYIARKHGEHEVTYYHPKMEEFLDKSFGILVYQDDLMSTALNLAGYTWKTVDKFRKAVGKKIPEEMAKQHKIFVEGCIEHTKMTKKEAEGLWDLFEPFQGYGFNKAHAASYGKVAYQTAYMKANYPEEYMTAALTADAGDVDKISEIIKETRRMGFEVLPPNINESFSDFTVVLDDDKEITGNIRFGLRSIKNFGEEIGKAIIHERKENGVYASISDFLDRITHKNLNKKSLDALIKSGSMDEFGERGTLLSNMEELLAYNKESKNKSRDQGSLFGDLDHATLPSFTLRESNPATKDEKLLWEKDLLGLYISGHPLDKIREKLEKRDLNIKKINDELGEGASIIIAGIVEESKNIITKKNQAMAFIKIADLSGSIDAVVFPKLYSEFGELFDKEKIIALSGKVSLRNGEKSIIIEKVKAI